MRVRHIVFALLSVVSVVHAQTLTLPTDRRPKWLSEDGIVMAGSWEPLLFRVRRDGSDGYTPTASQLAAYQREHSPEMVDRLKAMGVNFVMMHCYKGAGLEAERESMADAVRFAKLCHDKGLRVGVYVYSGAFIWELFFKEVPEAEDWVVRGEDGGPLRYGGGRVKYRYYWNRNHPAAEAFYRQIVRFAVNQIRTDLVHFDNYAVGPGYDANSVERFRNYLGKTFSPDQLSKIGFVSVAGARPPSADSPPLLRYAWDEFRCRSLADSYHAMSRYARSLRPDVLIECNPGSVSSRMIPPRDHGRLLQGGEAFWDESKASGFQGGKLRSHIRTYKVARAMNNMAFCYTTTPLEMAESMAFNQDCLGAVCWFEYDKIARRPGSDDPVSPDLEPSIRFFHKRRDLLRDTQVVADVTVLRNFPSQVFSGSRHSALTYEVEEMLIAERLCFQIIYDHQLGALKKPRVLVLAGCVALSDDQIKKVEAYVQSGGRVCVIGPVATYDDWMRPRSKPAFSDLPASQVVRIADTGDILGAIHRACEHGLSLSVNGPPGLCCELTEQPGRRLVHFVNYRSEAAANGITARVRLRPGRHAETVTLASPQRATDLEVPFTQEGGVVTFTIPEVSVYELAVIATRAQKEAEE